MDKICTNPYCTNTIKKDDVITEIPVLESKIKTGAIINILDHGIENFHIHQYGSTVIFLQYLEGLEIDEEVITDYNNQGHVFLLPMKAMDLVDLRDGKVQHLIYKAVENDSSDPWYKIMITKDQNTLASKILQYFRK